MTSVTHTVSCQLTLGVASSARQQQTPTARLLSAPCQPATRSACCAAQRTAYIGDPSIAAPPTRCGCAAARLHQAAYLPLLSWGPLNTHPRPWRHLNSQASSSISSSDSSSSAQSPVRRASGSSWRMPRPAVAARRRGAVTVAAVAGPRGAGSTGEGEEPDLEVSRELESFDVERFRRAGAHLDLMWNVEKVPALSSRVLSLSILFMVLETRTAKQGTFGTSPASEGFVATRFIRTGLCTCPNPCLRASSA